MKVIDLLNKIANGEELPKKISINDYKVYDEYTIWTFEDGCYSRNIKGGERQFLFEYIIPNMLNDEVEILEENKNIEHIEHLNMRGGTIHALRSELQETYVIFETKLNEIIDKINGGNYEN